MSQKNCIISCYSRDLYNADGSVENRNIYYKNVLIILIFLFSVIVMTAERISATVFPIRISENRRYFVDQENVPFFIHSDTPWSLFVALNKTEAETYLENRKQKGFNTITVNLIEHWFNGDSATFPFSSKNRDGELPFTAYLSGNIPDFTKPNEKYFANVDYILKNALENGILVMMTPAYMGYIGTQEGWYNEVLANGALRCREWGIYLGKRYKRFPNIVWVMDGDRNPDSLSVPLEREIVAGIKENDNIHLFTAHAHPCNSSRDRWEGESWLDINAIYTYNWMAYVHEKCLDNYKRKPVMPIILFETCYEGEHNFTSEKIRAEMYWGWLCCIAGQQMGNNPIWKFATGWQAAMDGQSSRDASRLKKMVASRNWFKLIPDFNHQVVTAGYASADNYVSVARAEDGETIIAYIPSGGGEISLDLSKISGRKAKAWWYSPGLGTAKLIGTYSTKGNMKFIPPDNDDWLLVIDDASKNFHRPGQ
jgi:hypothetical protein